MRVLIADDDQGIQGMLSTAMWALGFEPLLASDAMQAIMYARNSGPRVILLDINMPGGTGMLVLKRLKSLPATRSIPIIVISAVEGADVPAQMKEMGAADFFRKPLDMQALLHRIADLAAPPRAETLRERERRLQVVKKRDSSVA
jgi:DNA-binding response OmpR family regulator